MKFSIDSSVKIDILTKSLKNSETRLYEALTMHGYDPETFDEYSFTPKEDDIHDQTILEILSSVLATKAAIQTVENE